MLLPKLLSDFCFIVLIIKDIDALVSIILDPNLTFHNLKFKTSMYSNKNFSSHIFT